MILIKVQKLNRDFCPIFLIKLIKNQSCFNTFPYWLIFSQLSNTLTCTSSEVPPNDWPFQGLYPIKTLHVNEVKFFLFGLGNQQNNGEDIDSTWRLTFGESQDSSISIMLSLSYSFPFSQVFSITICFSSLIWPQSVRFPSIWCKAFCFVYLHKNKTILFLEFESRVFFFPSNFETLLLWT